MKNYWKVSANSGHECLTNSTFQRTVEIWVTRSVSAFTKTFAEWKSATMFGGMKTLSLTSAGAWNEMQGLPSTGGSSWKEHSSKNNFFVYFYYGTMWAFCEYISPRFSIICLIQQVSRLIILFNTFQIRACILKNLSDKKNEYDFWIHRKKLP